MHYYYYHPRDRNSTWSLILQYKNNEVRVREGEITHQWI